MSIKTYFEFKTDRRKLKFDQNDIPVHFDCVILQKKLIVFNEI